MENELSELERAVLMYGILTGIKDFKKLWSLCNPGRNIEQSSISVAASRWKNSIPVQNYIDWIKAKFVVGIQEQRKKETETAINSTGQNGLQIDFSDREQFIKFLNESLNTITDDKTRTDYLKMLSDLLRFKESTPDSQNDIQRFYVGVNCCNCAIYKNSLK